LIRIPPEIHRDLALKAAEEGISLNRLISDEVMVFFATNGQIIAFKGLEITELPINPIKAKA